MKRLVIAATLVAVAAAAYWVVAKRAAPLPARAEPLRHVLLITIDTLRADRLGSYGYAPARTPTLDALASRGVRFEHAYATAPITLTSHASMLTGRIPPRHGARHNGIAVTAGVPTVAESFSRAGFETGAFVSAFPLDRRFGLARGFHTYDAELPRRDDGRHAVERAGADTVDRAIAWLRARGARRSVGGGRPASRVFGWIHLFEPHAPYGNPDGGGNASARYDEEVAIADREVGRLLGAWPDLANTLVIAAADHGEAFGEHGETGHSIFVYDTTLRIPLILAGPGLPAGTVVPAPAFVADLAPTMLGIAGVPGFETDGVDLRSVIAGPSAPRDLYAESMAPLVDFGWASLRSLRRGDAKLIAAPRPELYEFSVDPAEERNIIGKRARLASDLAAAVDRISGPEPETERQIDAEAIARLRALGYASGGGASGPQRPDPKDRIAVASQLAAVTSGELQGTAAERALRDALRQDPQNPQAQQRLGFVLAESGRCREAERHFGAAIAGRLPSADPYLGLAMCQAGRGAAAEALDTLRAARRAEPGNPIVEANIGLTSLQRGRVEDAIEALGQALEIDPDLHQARFALARALGRAGRREAALREATELLRRLPPTAPQRPEIERLAAALR